MKLNQKSGRSALKIAALTCILGAFSPALLPMNAAHAQAGITPPATGAPATNVARKPRATPAEREAARAAREATQAARREKSLRTTLSRGGVSDATTQDAVIEYARNEMAARTEAATATGKVMKALRTGAVTDAQFNILLNEMRDAAAQERTRRVRTAAVLDTQIGYTKKPRLEAVLVLSGLVGDEASTLSAALPAMPRMAGGRRAAGANAAGNAARPRRNRRNAAPAAAPNAMPAP